MLFTKKTFRTIFFWGLLGLLLIFPSKTEGVCQQVEMGINYLTALQNSDGGFPLEKGLPSSPEVTDWVVMALAAAGEEIDSKTLTYLAKERSLTSITDYARTILALTAIGEKEELSEELRCWQLSSGQFARKEFAETELVNGHLWSVLALVSAGKAIPEKEKALNWLVAQQNEDGGFAWAVGGDSDPDSTGIALSALAILGVEKEAIVVQRALEYLKSRQTLTGGFAWWGEEPNTATNAWVIQGLIAIGENPIGDKWLAAGKSPRDHLIALQNEDGSFQWMEGVNSSTVLMTAYALVGLTDNFYPVNVELTKKTFSLANFKEFLLHTFQVWKKGLNLG